MAFDMGTVLPCSPLTLPCRLSRFVVLYSVSPCVSSASRFASRLCVSSCVLFMRLAVASRHCVPFSLLAVGCDMTFIRGAVSSCLPLAVSPCVSCSMPFLVSVLRFRSASCHCVSLLPLVLRAVFLFGTVSLCSPLVLPFRALALRFCSRLVLRADMRFCFASRSMPSCVSSCVSSCVPSCVLPLRSAFLLARWMRLS